MAEQGDSTRTLGRIMWLLAWLLALVLMTWYFQQKLEQDRNPNRQVQLLDNATLVLEQNRQGHYLAGGAINGQAVVFLLDTGATQVAVPRALAERLGLAPGRRLALNTAAGQAEGYATRIKTLSLGPLSLYDLDAVIMPSDSTEVLLGMNALRQFELIQRGSRLTIRHLDPAP
ncbi:retropepsin-like aspartic protease family protein [Zobellella taiwanensis]|jgi:aspartyl protease family protein|uniref:TIGR02281 family clan AA aspartic protease n=1 Tax=Zobellella taiwanensis TaxID=347535 RepID=A0A2P7QG81_9GAMM|nr:retropepsin-like aspartic protease [Zobellella taiwanensis]PSJ36950.1 TIGR02281 family clan AA aspartic protease [Zobellella taiwanensis]